MPTTRRTFTPEFKAEAVRLVTEQGSSFVEVERDPIHGQVKARYGSPRVHAELVARGCPAA